MPVYTWRQNNSGGMWTPPAETIIVEADDVLAARGIAGQHGVRFESHDDCECCGYRWYREPDGSGEDGRETSLYSQAAMAGGVVEDMTLVSVIEEFSNHECHQSNKTWRGEDLPHYKVLERSS